MTEIIEKLEHGIMVCLATGTAIVHIGKGDAEKVVSLLKKQEPVEPILDSYLKRRCPSCGALLQGKYCHECGQEVKLDERKTVDERTRS